MPPKNLSHKIDNSFSNTFKKSYKLLNKKEKNKLKKNIILSFLAGIIEILSLTSFYPLVTIIVEPKLIIENKLINNIWIYLGQPEQFKFVIFLAIITSFVLIFSTFLNLFSQILSTNDASAAEERLAKEFFNNLIYSPYRWHLKNNPNITRNIILTNINFWNKTVIRIIPAIAGQFSAIVLAIITLLLTTPKLGLVLLLFSGSFLTLLLKFVRKRSGKLMDKYREKQELINIFLTESLSGIKDIKLSSNENNFIKIFYSLNHIIIRNFGAAANWNLLPTYLVILFGQLSILITATSLFIIGIRGGELAANMAIIVLIFSRIIPLLNRLGTSLNNIANYGSFIAKMDKTINSVEKEKKISYTKSAGIIDDKELNWRKVKFAEVGFRYPNTKKPIFEKLDFEIKRGLHYAFVGYSGAGKSTAIDLFLGLLEPTNGSITIDGIDLKKIGIRRWQKTINYVPQSPIITNLSLRENIAFGVAKELIDDERVIDCLKQTDLFSLSQSLEKGIYTNLGNAGTLLSGGQKQRVAISRALYKNSDILVLDEATSSLDTQTEEIIQKTIKNLKNKMTVISIAHRFSTIRNCDCIYLIDNGDVLAKGPFETLMQESETFRKLSASQIFDN